VDEDERQIHMPDHGTKAPDTALLDEEMQTAIQAAIDELPEVQRMAIVLRRYDDISYEEIGEILEISPNTVAGRYRYGLEKLRACLRQENYERLESHREDFGVLDAPASITGA